MTSIKEINTWTETKLKCRIEEEIAKKFAELKAENAKLKEEMVMHGMPRYMKSALTAKKFAELRAENAKLKAEVEKNNHRSAWFYIQGNGDPDVFELWGTREEMETHIKKENKQKRMDSCGCPSIETPHEECDCGLCFVSLSEFVNMSEYPGNY